MVENVTAESAGSNEGDDTNAAKKAACLECRRSKVKCVKAADSSACKKCASAGIECHVPDYHVGRYKGVKNKRSGLEKAIFQVEEAVKKARTKGSGLQDEHAQALQRLLDETNGDSQPCDQLSPETRKSKHYQPTNHTKFQSLRQDLQRHPLNRSPSMPSFRQDSFSQSEQTGQVTINNADNPLQLLAIASAIPEQTNSITSPSTVNKVSPDDRSTNTDNRAAVTEDDETQEFFSPTASRLDVGAELDPVDLGLVTMSEAKKLFAYFHERLSHTRWGLDQAIHTPNFVRCRSAYLFTSILTASSLFLHDCGSLSTRLYNHCKTLAHKISANGYRSLEIVLAYMVNIPWMQPGKNWAMDDETCSYLSIALTIAIDLSLHKIVIPSTTMRPQGTMEKIAQADCIDAQRALNIDGHTNIDPTSVFGRRLLRARERTWLALFTLDRGVCLARGRPWTVPSGPLIDTCDAWHVSDIADPWDGSLIASCVLRRDFGSLVASVRATCDNNHNTTAGSGIVKFMREKVEGFFTQWHNTWSFQIRQNDGSIPPYVDILVSHGKLSAYCNVINHPTASTDMKQFFKAAGLTAALNVMRVAVQNESKLHSMPNNSVIMVSFAACFVLGLSTTRRGNQMYLAQNAKNSIQDAADVLERIGTVTPHRKGASSLFGKHIKRIMRQHTDFTEATTLSQGDQLEGANLAAGHGSNNITMAPYTLQPMSEEAQHSFPGFDSMTDDQLLEAIQNARQDLDSLHAGMQPEDGLFMDWLDWPNLT